MLTLLPDVTLGIARLAKGELAEETRPLRLSYEGQALRANGSATRPARQFGQVGVEVIGLNKSKEPEKRVRSTIAFDLISLAIKACMI